MPKVKKVKKEKTAKSKDVVVKFMLGGMGHEAEAQQRADGLQHENAAFYRSDTLPNPRSYKNMTIKSIVAKPVKLATPKTPLYPYAVEATVTLTGDKESIKQWTNKLNASIRIYQNYL